MKAKLSVLYLLYTIFLLALTPAAVAQHHHKGHHKAGPTVWGVVETKENGSTRPVDYATVYLKGSQSGGTTDEQGRYSLDAAAASDEMLITFALLLLQATGKTPVLELHSSCIDCPNNI